MNKYLIAFAFVVLIVLVFISPFNKPNDIEPILRKREDSLRTLLTESERKRLVLGARVDSLDIRCKNLDRMNRNYDSILTKVKGSYNKFRPTELGNEMIRRYNASK